MTKTRSLKQKGKTQNSEMNSEQVMSEESSGDKAIISSPKTFEYPFDLGYAHLLNGNALQPLTQEEFASNAKKYSSPLERNIKSQSELEKLLLANGKILFGENSVLVDLQKKTGLGFSGGFSPAGILLDFHDIQKPKLFLIETFLSENSFCDLFYQMTGLFSFFRSEESVNRFTDALEGVISKDKALKKELQAKAGSGEIREILGEILKRKPAVLLIMNIEKTDLPMLMETYTETWGRLVKPMLVRKFSCKGDTIVTIRPQFAELNNKKNAGVKEIKSTEEDHLENVSEAVKEGFLAIKKELLKADKELEFRVKQYYISVRKNRNLFFLQPGKRKLSVVIANPEKNTRKQIKHHKTLTLAESVKKFWNGNEDCFTVVIESKEYLNEVIALLKKLVANA